MMAALCAAQRGARVILLEQLSRVGRKLLATGGGRCNLTNRQPLAQLLQSYNAPASFVRPALKAFGPQALVRFFEQLGLAIDFPDGHHGYPASGRAGDVLTVLFRHVNACGVQVHTATRVESLMVEAGRVVGVVSSAGEFAADAVIIAAGGSSYPSLGSDGSGYGLARGAGHRVVTPVTGLVGLEVEERWPARCAGLSLTDAQVHGEGGEKGARCRGGVLFTHRGLSGPAVLNLSAQLSRRLLDEKRVVLRLRPLAAMGREQWMGQFELWRREVGSKGLCSALSTLLPSKLAVELCTLTGVASTRRVGELTKAERGVLLEALAEGIVLHVNGAGGFDNAMVTAGGVDCTQVDSATMQSRLVEGLFFCGEVLDVDGPCGGYNLQWAFASGFCAGTHVLSSIEG
jgi:predicted Rossmann fold flavoprotein